MRHKNVFRSVTAAVCLILTLLLISCRGGTHNPLAFRDGAFRAELRITSGGSTRSAEFEYGALRDDSVGRDARLRFLSPERLSGITVERKDGAVTMTAGDLTVSGGDGYLSFCDLLAPVGTVSSEGIVNRDGKRLTYLLVSTESGNVAIYLSREGYPVRIESDDVTIDVIWFEPSAYSR